MNAQDIYRSKRVAIDEAVSHIQSDNDVIVAQCASEPQGCMSRFHIVGDRVQNVRVFSVLTLREYDFYMKPEMQGHFELASWFHLLRHLHAAGQARLRLPLAGHHLREGHHGPRPPRHPRGEPAPAADLR